MRYALVCFLLAACSSEPSQPPADVPCGGACGSGTACVAGRCEAVDAGPPDTGPRCPASTFCTSAEVPGGSCFDLQTDARHCGRCGNACTSSQRCVAGTCIEWDPMCGATRPCPIPGSSSTACYDLQTHMMNCGMCGRACPSNARCMGGQCVIL